MYDIIHDKNVLDIPSIVSYVKSLQQEDGSFAMDKWGEIDTRFSFCAVATLSLIGHLDAINEEKVILIMILGIIQIYWKRWHLPINFNNCNNSCYQAVSYVCECMNFDGGFGTRPGSESHAGQIYCCVAFLSITGDLHKVDADWKMAQTKKLFRFQALDWWIGKI